MKSESIEDMLSKLDTPRKELTKWEEDFISSVTEQFKIRNSLSERQIEILERIYTEKS